MFYVDFLRYIHTSPLQSVSFLLSKGNFDRKIRASLTHFKPKLLLFIPCICGFDRKKCICQSNIKSHR